jgi:hypothetical protein
MAQPISQADQAVTSATTNIVAPAACRAIRVQQKQGSAPPSPAFHIYGPTGSVDVAGSPFPGGSNVEIVAAPGTQFAQGQVVGQTAAVAAFTGTVTFTVFAQPVVAGSSLSASGLLSTQVTLTSADLLAIQNTAKQIVPGIAGYILVPHKITMRYKFGATAYTLGNADNQFRLQYTGQTTAISGALAAAGLVDQVANRTLQALMVAFAAAADAAVSGLGIELKLAVGTTPVLTLGDGTVVVTLDYVPVPAG